MLWRAHEYFFRTPFCGWGYCRFGGAIYPTRRSWNDI